MSWARLDDQANRSAKLLALSDAGWRMWGCGLIYCQEGLTDGFIPTQIIETFGVKAPNKKKVAAELCSELVPGAAPLWKAVPGGYQVHDYLDWNDSRETVLSRRQSNKRRQQKLRHMRGDPPLLNALHPPLCNALRTTDVTRDTRGTYSEGTKRQYHGSTEHLTSEYSAERAGAAHENAPKRKATVWTRGLAICHGVIEDFPDASGEWRSQLKVRMANQGIDPNDCGLRGDKTKFFERVLAACLEQRKFRRGDGGVIEWRWRHRARQKRLGGAR